MASNQLLHWRSLGKVHRQNLHIMLLCAILEDLTNCEKKRYQQDERKERELGIRT